MRLRPFSLSSAARRGATVGREGRLPYTQKTIGGREKVRGGSFISPNAASPPSGVPREPVSDGRARRFRVARPSGSSGASYKGSSRKKVTVARRSLRFPSDVHNKDISGANSLLVCAGSCGFSAISVATLTLAFCVRFSAASPEFGWKAICQSTKPTACVDTS